MVHAQISSPLQDFLYKTGFLKLDPEHQRGEDVLTRKPILDTEKIERWADQLMKGEAYLGQLSWNFRKEETALEYDAGTHTLTIGAGAATIPDSYHRHMAILKAVDSAARGSGFEPLKRMFSVRIYNVPIEEENRIFYAMNQEGKKALELLEDAALEEIVNQRRKNPAPSIPHAKLKRRFRIK